MTNLSLEYLDPKAMIAEGKNKPSVKSKRRPKPPATPPNKGKNIGSDNKKKK